MRRIRLLPESKAAQKALLWTLRLCCAMVFASWVLLTVGPPEPDTYALYRLSGRLQTDSAAVLLLGNIAALLLEGVGKR